MNKLELLLDFLAIDPVAAMNGLQDAGLVSDLCVGPETVAATDIERACRVCRLLADMNKKERIEKPPSILLQ